MQQFIKRSEANSQQKLSLFSEDGKDYFLLICSAYSDQYKIKKAEVFRLAAQSATDGKYTPEVQLEMTAKMAAGSICGWFLPEEFGDYSPAGAEKLLLEYPQILEAVDVFSSKNENFIQKK